MGGMAVLEWPLCTPPGFVRHVIPLATSARHSAWCISWGEAQRQSIYSDPGYQDGFYDKQPASGLAAARMSALLTYRTRDSFESKFGRRPQVRAEDQEKLGEKPITPPESPKRDGAIVYHNDGHKNARPRTVAMSKSAVTVGNILVSSSRDKATLTSSAATAAFASTIPKPQIFSAQSYLRYQGDKFVNRFDANCYIHMTRKLDSHDISRDRMPPDTSGSQALKHTLSILPPRALVISIATDGLFTPFEQREIADNIPEAELVSVHSPDGHDGFLLEFEVINRHILRFLRKEFPEYYVGEEEEYEEEDFAIKKTSMFGEAEVDITRW